MMLALNWWGRASFRTLARTADGDPLSSDPLVVTSAGIARAA